MSGVSWHLVYLQRKAVVEDGLRPEDHELFQNAGLVYINQGDTTQLLDFIQDEKNQVNASITITCPPMKGPLSLCQMSNSIHRYPKTNHTLLLWSEQYFFLHSLCVFTH